MPGFDDSRLDPSFGKLSKPAQRALVNAGILSPKHLARHTRAEIAALHGIGPSAFPTLESALKSAGLKWK